MQMDDEVSHHGVVHRLLRLAAPRALGGGVIGENADDIERAGIFEGCSADAFEFAAEHDVEELL